MTELSIFPNSILGNHKIEWCEGHILLGTQIFLSLSMIMTTVGNKRSGKDRGEKTSSAGGGEKTQRRRRKKEES